MPTWGWVLLGVGALIALVSVLIFSAHARKATLLAASAMVQGWRERDKAEVDAQIAAAQALLLKQRQQIDDAKQAVVADKQEMAREHEDQGLSADDIAERFRSNSRKR